MRAYPGQDFTDNYVTATRLHNLVDNGVGHTMRAADLVSGLRMVGNAAQGAPTTGDSYLDASGRLRLYYGGVYNDFSFAEIVTLNNGTGGNVTVGDVVVGDSAADFSVMFADTASRPDARVVGAVAANAAAAAPTQVHVRNAAYVKCNCAGGPYTAGAFVLGPQAGINSSSGILDQDPTDGSVSPDAFGGSYFAQTLQDSPAAGVTLILCWLWR